MDMAPATPQSHQPLLLLYPLTYGLPVSMVRKHSLATMSMPFPPEFRRAEPERGPLGMPTFRVLRRVVRCLRAVLSKVLERCSVAMEILHSTVSPASAGKGRALVPPAERGGLGPPGVARERGRDPAGQEWHYTTDLKVLDEGEVLAPDVKTVDGDDAPGGEEELDLSDWLEWESDEEEEEEEEESPSDCADPSGHAPEPVLYQAPWGRGAACQNSPTGLHSQGEHSESDWSDEDDDDIDDGDDDDDEWDESDDDEDDDEWDESDESSELDSELWESFLCSGDHSNPFRLSPPAEKKGRVPETVELSSTGSLRSAEGERENEEERENEGEDERDSPPPHPGKKAGKKVQFSGEVQVRPLVAWAFASRAARDGSCWLEMARDRDRFRRRVQTASDIISPYLQANHRARLWERFQLT